MKRKSKSEPNEQKVTVASNLRKHIYRSVAELSATENYKHFNITLDKDGYFYCDIHSYFGTFGSNYRLVIRLEQAIPLLAPNQPLHPIIRYGDTAALRRVLPEFARDASLGYSLLKFEKKAKKKAIFSPASAEKATHLCLVDCYEGEEEFGKSTASKMKKLGHSRAMVARYCPTDGVSVWLFDFQEGFSDEERQQLTVDEALERAAAENWREFDANKEHYRQEIEKELSRIPCLHTEWLDDCVVIRAFGSSTKSCGPKDRTLEMPIWYCDGWKSLVNLKDPSGSYADLVCLSALAKLYQTAGMCIKEDT